MTIGRLFDEYLSPPASARHPGMGISGYPSSRGRLLPPHLVKSLSVDVRPKGRTVNWKWFLLTANHSGQGGLPHGNKCPPGKRQHTNLPDLAKGL